MSENSKKILYFTYELSPFCEVGVDVERFTQVLDSTVKSGSEVRVFMPRFGSINERRNRLHEVKRLSGDIIEIDGVDYSTTIKVASLPQSKMQAYFVECMDLYQKKMCFVNAKKQFLKNNDEKLIFFSKASVNMFKKLLWLPDYIVCYGWFSALVPAYLRQLFEANKEQFPQRPKIVFMVPNDTIPEALDKNLVKKVQSTSLDAKYMEHFGNQHQELLNGAIALSDEVVFFHEEYPEQMEFAKKAGIKTTLLKGDNQKEALDFLMTSSS